MRVLLSSVFKCPAEIEKDMSVVDFEVPDRRRFPCLDLAYRALAGGGSLPAVMNAANEEAVAAFDRALGRAFVAFQPIVSFRDRTVFGWEALVRTREHLYCFAPRR